MYCMKKLVIMINYPTGPNLEIYGYNRYPLKLHVRFYKNQFTDDMINFTREID